jgi:hypothetical protein
VKPEINSGWRNPSARCILDQLSPLETIFAQGVAMFDWLTINTTLKALWLVVVMFMFSLGGHICSGQGHNKVELIPFLESWQKQPVETKTNLALKTEWIGTVKRVYLRDPQSIYKEEEPEHIRFNEVFARRSLWQTNEPVRVSIVRMRKSPSGGGHYVGGEAPKFYEKLPAVTDLSKAKDLTELKQYFGGQHGITDGWGGLDGRLNWSEGWICFTVEAKDKLRYLSIFAHVSKSKEDNDASVDIITIKEGEFRPADPNSAEEKAKYKTGEALFAEEVADLKVSQEKYPMPLRRMVAASQQRGDYELKAYKQELAAFRSKPDALLIKQLVQQLHDDGTAEFSVMMYMLFAAEDFPGAPWTKETRRDAARLLVETLPDIKKADVLQKVIFKILEIQGGGKFKLEGKNPTWEIDLSVELTENGHSTSYRTSPKDNLVPQAALVCLEEFKMRYPELWLK